MPAPGVMIPQAPIDASPGQQGMIPFRQATTERSDILPPDSRTVTANTQQILNPVQGTGLLYKIWLNMIAVAVGNTAQVAFPEDMPHAAFDRVQLYDVNGDLVNVNGFALFVANLIDKQYGVRYLDGSADPAIFQKVAGGAAAAGSFASTLELPIGINRRDLVGIVSNQDRSQIYTLRNDLASSGSCYATAPTTLPPVTITKQYDSYTVPLPTSPTGQKQEQLPEHYGTLHVLTTATNPTVPASGTQPHYLPRIGNAIRWIALILRSNSLRSTADLNRPTQIQLKMGDEILFTESYTKRRSEMYERFGFEFPLGVLVYDAMHDFGDSAGSELGEDYYHTNLVQSAYFNINYPTGFGTTANSLEVVTDDLISAARR